MEYIDLDMEYTLMPTPIHSSQPQVQALVKPEPVREPVDVLPDLAQLLQGTSTSPPTTAAPEPPAAAPKVATEVRQPSPTKGYPMSPRLVYSFCKPNEMYLGPTRIVVLPPTNPTADRQLKRQDQWGEYLINSPGSVLCLNRRAVSRPALEDTLSKLRERATRKNGGPHRVAVQDPSLNVVPSSLTAACLTLTSWMLALVNASFTVQQAASDFLLLSLLRQEVVIGVYTTPPQIILQLRRRASLFTNSREAKAAVGIVDRMDLLWRRWNAHGMQRPWNMCHQYIEATGYGKELGYLNKLGNESLMKSMFVCGAGNIPDIDNNPPTEDDGRMTLQNAEKKLRVSHNTYPGFLVKAPLESLSWDKEYNICFLPLSSVSDISAMTTRTIFIRNWAAPFMNVPTWFATLDIKPTVPHRSPPKPHKETRVSRDKRGDRERDTNKRERGDRVKEAEERERGQRQVKRSATPTKPAKKAKVEQRAWALEEPVRQTGGKRYFARLVSTASQCALVLGLDVINFSRPRVTNPTTAQSMDMGRVVALHDNGDRTSPVVTLKMWSRHSADDFEVIETDILQEFEPDKLLTATLHVRSTADVTLKPVGQMKDRTDIWKLLKCEKGKEWFGGTKAAEDKPLELRMLCWRRAVKSGVEPIKGAVEPEPSQSSSESSSSSSSESVGGDVLELSFAPTRSPAVSAVSRASVPTPPPSRTRSLNLRRTPPPGVKAEPKAEPKMESVPQAAFDVSAIIAQSNAQPMVATPPPAQRPVRASIPLATPSLQTPKAQNTSSCTPSPTPPTRRLKLVRPTKTPT
eukprot:TRINITY_DN24716_c0_g1_i1.p1 TRINITY_DN24716_c0_g1~~TRINITY_DN24716_c0_g1_i1.p1  ORF type:complete len:823 (+),score=167.84 TRINITY_DN24716_c0_g1_i1:65-2470(+)